MHSSLMGQRLSESREVTGREGRSRGAPVSRSIPGMAMIVTLGNPQRGDDGAGPAVAARLREAGVDVVELGEPTRLVDILPATGTVVVVDAVISGAPPGSVLVLDLTDAPLPRKVTASSHTISLAQGLELARTLGAWPDRLILVGIEVEELRPDPGLNPITSRAVGIAVEVIIGLVGGRV